METQTWKHRSKMKCSLGIYFQFIIFTNIPLKESSQLKALKVPHVEKKTLIYFYVVKGYLGHKQS